MTAKPVMDGRVPEKGGGKEDEADYRPENVVEDTAEPMSEEP